MKPHLLIALLSAAGVLVAPLARADKNDSREEVKRAYKHVKEQKKSISASDDDDFDDEDALVDSDGSEHVRMARKHKGMRVIGGDVVVHSERGGKFREASGSLGSEIKVNTKPSVSAGAAISYAKSLFGGVVDGEARAELVVYARQSPAVLAWDVSVQGTVTGQPASMHYVINAGSLQLLDKFSDLHFAVAAGSAKTLHSGNVTINADSLTSTTLKTTLGGNFQLKDPSRGNHYVSNLKGALLGTGTILADSDNVWGNNATSDQATAGADVAYGHRLSWDYFLGIHGRKGFDNKGSTGYSKVNYGTGIAANRAFFDASCMCMSFGSGDGVTQRPYTSIDVVGHEMAHGVTGSTAKLIYSGESGGLNEATSDIFGTMIEFAAANPVNPGNFLIGERLYPENSGVLIPTRARRYMFKPSLDGLSPDCYNSTVALRDPHQASGPANRFFYLLAQGATVPAGFATLTPASLVCNGNIALKGVGRDVAAKIWYRALTVYMTSTTNYAAARKATLSAAKDLYGLTSVQYKTVADAWSAVLVN